MTNEIDKRIGLHLTDAEIVDLLGKQAATAAMEIANKKVNNLVAISFALFGLLAGAALLFIDQRVKAQVPDAVSTEVESSVFLPLIAAEINRLSNGTLYDPLEADRVIGILDALTDDIEAMEGDAYWLATRRLEDVADVFLNAGDYARVFEIDRIFDHKLIENDGIFVTFAFSMASGIVIHPDFTMQHQTTLERLLGRGLDHRSTTYETQRLVRVLHRVSQDEWTKDALMAEFNVEYARDPYFHTVLFGLVESLQVELSDDGSNHTPVSESRYAILTAAMKEY